MKYFSVLLIAFVSLLMSCNRQEGEPIYAHKKIVKEFEPRSQVIDWGNMTSEERHQYPRKGFVINSLDEFPATGSLNLNMNDLKLMNIDFSRYTLLVNYSLVPGYIEGHRLNWYFDNADDVYAFQSNFKTVYINPDEDPEADYNSNMCTYYRAAILVDKISQNTKVSFRSSYY